MAALQRLSLPSGRGNHDRWLGDIERTAANSRDESARTFAGLARRTRHQ
jgi:hypothetical protein